MQITIKGLLELEDKRKLDNLMRVYCSAKRYAFNRLVEGRENLNEVRKEIMEVFGLNARYVQPAIVDAKAMISAQKELLPRYLEEVQDKIKVTTKKLNKHENKFNELKNSDKSEEIKEQAKKVNGIKQRLNKLRNKKQEYEEHIKNKTIPKIVFGGKNNGAKEDKGNKNLRLTWQRDNNFELRINIGERNWIKGEVKIPEKYCTRLKEQIEHSREYSVRVIRKEGKYHCYISFDVPNNAKSNKKGIAGIDLNPEKIAVTIVDNTGNFIASNNFPCYAVVFAKKNKRDWIIGNTVKDVYEWINGFGINTIAVEHLKFRQNHDTNKEFNRITHNFAKKRMRVAIESRAIREGLEVREVDPAYTSFIGTIKYKDIFGLSTHQAAALVIARRGLDLKEKIPKPLRGLKPLRRQWKDGSWASTLKWKYLSSAVKRKLTHFFKTKNYKRILGSGGYTALQYASARGTPKACACFLGSGTLI
ncbi:MAG: IS200/IS605 family accessory protein TnpB-related protein, partial [Methanosarcinales archaeon]